MMYNFLKGGGEKPFSDYIWIGLYLDVCNVITTDHSPEFCQEISLLNVSDSMKVC